MPREFLKHMVPDLATMKAHAIPFLCIVGMVMAFYFASLYIAPGWITYGISTAAVALIGITAVARVNDIGHDKTALRWQVRRGGLILVAAASLGLCVQPALAAITGLQPDFPSWREVMMRVGVCATWLTTPFMPPWHRYMSGEFRKLVVEVPEDVRVDIVRTDTSEESGGAMFTERRKADTPEEFGP